MLASTIFKAVSLALPFCLSHAASVSPALEERRYRSEPLVIPKATRVAAPIVPTVKAIVGNLVVNLNTTTGVATSTDPADEVTVTNLAGTVLIFARDVASSYSAFSGLNSYGIPYQVVIVSQGGINLPILNSSTTVGNYDAIVVLSEVSYESNSTGLFSSALTDAQWATLYQYQVSFGVRMVRLDIFPGPAIGGCCNTGVEQLISISNTTAFPTAGLKTGAGVSTEGLWHYPASITNSTIAVEIAQFAPTTGFLTTSTAAIINTFGGRQQMVWFTSFATDWSATSNFLHHAWITWVTRGLYTGYRRINLNTQVDDMFLTTDIYDPPNTTFLITTTDLAEHVTWMKSVNSRLPSGSSYVMEIGHNGNGNIEDAVYNTNDGERSCGVGPIEYPDQIDTPLEFAKPLGTGTSLWPNDTTTYPYTVACTNYDDLKKWWATTSNRDAFSHVSHTFTHEDQDNATYFDVTREISWNAAWLTQVGISGAERFSSSGIIPPAITGLHNGDALQAWLDNGIIYVVGDNTRPVLMNTINEHWPLMTTVAENGYAGVQINPRWATNIYYNCQLPNCTVLEWINTSAGSGNFTDLMAVEENTNIRHLLGLHHDPFMFHQANLNYVTAQTTTVNGVSAKPSLFQVWVETMIQELIRLINWPIISLKHDDMAVAFVTNPTAKTITSITLTTPSNTCNETIPITVPGSVTSTQGFTSEQVGSDPLTIWVQLSGSPINFTLSDSIPFYE